MLRLHFSVALQYSTTLHTYNRAGAATLQEQFYVHICCKDIFCSAQAFIADKTEGAVDVVVLHNHMTNNKQTKMAWFKK